MTEHDRTRDAAGCLAIVARPLFPSSPSKMSDIYCAEQIKIPPTFPHILKLYAKAAIRTQPYDLLRWTCAYFRALANDEVPPVKVNSRKFPAFSPFRSVSRSSSARWKQGKSMLGVGGRGNFHRKGRSIYLFHWKRNGFNLMVKFWGYSEVFAVC